MFTLHKAEPSSRRLVQLAQDQGENGGLILVSCIIGDYLV